MAFRIICQTKAIFKFTVKVSGFNRICYSWLIEQIHCVKMTLCLVKACTQQAQYVRAYIDDQNIYLFRLDGSNYSKYCYMKIKGRTRVLKVVL